MAVCSDLIYMALEALIGVACCVGNALVIWAVWSSGALQHATFCFIMSLAVADLLVGALAVPLAIVVSYNVVMPFEACLFICCVVVVLTQASVLSLLAIAVDRYLRVYIPLKYKRKVKVIHSWIVVAICWITANLLGFVPMFGWNKGKNSTVITCEFQKVMSMSYMVEFHFASCILPAMIIMTTLYCCIFFTISRQLRRVSGCTDSSHKYYLKEQKLARLLVLIMILFAACWLPINILNILYFNKVQFSPIYVQVGILLSHANSIVNPVVYAFKIPKIRAAYRKAWRKLCSCQTEEPKDQMGQTAENNASSIT